MEVRAVRPQELEEMIALQCAIFRPVPERYRKYVFGDPSYEYGQTRVVVVDGALVATLRIWDRNIRIGGTSVRMGGIGGVGTHPYHRGKGYATALLRDASEWMHTQGYLTSVLFTEIGSSYYRRHGWASVPMSGFRVALTKDDISPAKAKDWSVRAFDEFADLDDVVVLYDQYNLQQSGALVRERPYWDSQPARVRGILPTVVARDSDGRLGGYLNYSIEGEEAEVQEVAETAGETAITALVDHFVSACRERGVRRICGEFSPWHPFVDLTVENCGGDLELTGHSATMWKCFDLQRLISSLLPELQARLSGRELAPTVVVLCVNGERVALSLSSRGRLQVEDASQAGEPVPLRGEHFWRMLLGESSWLTITNVLESCGVGVTPEQSSLLAALFQKRREVVYWDPDHF